MIIATDKENRAGLRDSLQQLIVGEFITLVEIDCTEFGGEIYRYHNHAVRAVREGEYPDIKAGTVITHPMKFEFKNKLYNYGETAVEKHGFVDNPSWSIPPIKFRNKEYISRPYALNGVSFETNQASTPTLIIDNLDNLYTALCLNYDDLSNAKVTITITLVDYLDNGKTPNADEYIDHIWYIDHKTNEDSELVSFKLSSPMDIGGENLPSRNVTTHCTWALRGWYRSGKGCTYAGSKMFDIDDNPVTDPSKDVCGGLLSSCRLRFTNELDFGGFPAVGMNT